MLTSTFSHDLVQDAIDAMKFTTTPLIKVVARGKLYHGTLDDWAVDHAWLLPKDGAACSRSTYCSRGNGGSMGHGQYFATTQKRARYWARAHLSAKARASDPVRMLSIEVEGSACKDGTLVCDLQGARVPAPLMWSCRFCPDGERDVWHVPIEDAVARAARTHDFLFCGDEVMFTAKGLARGIPIRSSPTR
jgi:hypothetical protein